MSERDILEALQVATTAAIGASTNPGLPVKYLGRVFPIPDDQKYLEIIYIPNNLTNEFWGKEKTYRGIFRLILHWPIDDAGFYEPMDLMASIAAHFDKGNQFPAGAQSVRVYENPILENALEAPPETLFVLSVWYMSFKP